MADTVKGTYTDKRGFIYMVEGTTPHCEKYDDAGVSKLTFTTGVPTNPAAIAVDAQGKIYIAGWTAGDTTGRFVIFDDEGKVKKTVTPTLLASPTGIFIDARNYIYVSTPTAIYKYDDEGVKITDFAT